MKHWIAATCFVAFLVAGCPPAAERLPLAIATPTRETWEYETWKDLAKCVNGESQAAEYIAWMGRQGWELVSTPNTSRPCPPPEYIFRRRRAI